MTVAPPPAEKKTSRRKETRAADGDGGLYLDKKRGLWIGELMVGWKPDPKNPGGRVRDRRKVSAKTQAECRTKLQQLRQDHAGGSLRDPSRETVESFFTDWLERTIKLRRRLSTYTQYRSLITVHVIPRLGSKPLRDVRTKHLDELYRILETEGRRPGYVRKGASDAMKTGLAPKTIRGLQVALHSGFERAVRLSLVTRNPADGAELPAVPRKRKMPVDVADVLRLLKHSQLTEDRCWPLWTFLATTGLRIGEALALRWANVDLDTGWFTVMEGIDRSGTIGETKTESGERDIPLTAPGVAALRAQRERQGVDRDLLGADYADQDLVFATSIGTPFYERNVLTYLKRAAKHAAVTEAICLHDLRRMTASLLVAAGVDIVTAAAILGHKNASVLLDVYAQALKAPKRAAAGALERALFGPVSPAPALTVAG